MTRGALYNMITKANRTVMYRVNTLIEAGLISEVVQVSPPYAKYLELTNKGKKVAECVDDLEVALSG